MVTDGADTSDAAIDESTGEPEGAIDSGVHRRRRPGALRARHPGHARRDAAQRRSKARRSSSTSCCRRPATRGQTVPLNVEDEGRIVSTQEVTLPPDGESATVRVRFTATDAGARAVPVQGAGAGRRAGHAEQRARRADRGQRPRARRCCTSKASRASRRSSSGARWRTTRTCRSSSCSAPRRTSTTGVDVGNADELVGGFPKTREELFAYRGAHSRQRRGGLVHARAAADDRRLRQQARRRPADARRPPLVRRRRLGRHAGRRSAAGRPRATPNAKYLAAELAVRPTRAGATFPVTQIAGDETASAARWNEMPAVTAVNPVRGSSRARPCC